VPKLGRNVSKPSRGAARRFSAASRRVRTAGVSEFEDICATMKKAASALREAGVPFLLAGGLAAWARGGPSSNHDVDFLVRPDDVEAAAETLAAAGFRIERPPEGWLVKAYDGDVLVDLIFEPTTGPVTEDLLGRGEEREVLATPMRIMALEDVMVTKLLALGETHLDLSGPLEIARPVREQIDWDEVRRRTDSSPYARAFFTLVEELGVVEPTGTGIG
jgi:hypothetical protein